MSTKQAMITEIQSDTERSSTAEATAIGNKIDAAIRFYQPKRFWFNESRDATFNTVASTASYSYSTIGSEFYKLDGVFLTNGSEVTELCRANYTELETADTQTGVPSRYAYVNRALRIHSSPDDVYAVRLTGHIKIAIPATADTADNEWFTEAYDLIKAHAKAELYAHRWEDPASASIQQVIAAGELLRLQAATHDAVALGHLEATDF
jgi:hypothetical protein